MSEYLKKYKACQDQTSELTEITSEKLLKSSLRANRSSFAAQRRASGSA